MKRTILSLLIVGLFAGAGISAFAKDAAMDAQSPQNTQDKALQQEKSIPQTSRSDANSIAPASSDTPTQANTNSELKAALDKVQAQFAEAKIQCDRMQGDAMRSCISEANATKKKGVAQANAQWGSQSKLNDKEGNSASQPSATNSAQVGGAPDTTPTSQQRSANDNPKGSGSEQSNDQTTAKAEYAAATDKAQVQYKDAKAKCDLLQGNAASVCVTDAKSVQRVALAQALSEMENQPSANATDADALERSNKGMKAKGGMKPEVDGAQGDAPKPNTQQ